MEKMKKDKVVFILHYCKKTDMTFLTKESKHKIEVINFSFGKVKLDSFDLTEKNLIALI